MPRYEELKRYCILLETKYVDDYLLKNIKFNEHPAETSGIGLNFRSITVKRNLGGCVHLELCFEKENQIKEIEMLPGLSPTQLDPKSKNISHKLE